MKATARGRPSVGRNPANVWVSVESVDSRATINVSQKSIHRFKHRIREITGRSRGISMDHRLRELAHYVRGWMGYFALASQLKLFVSLEQ